MIAWREHPHALGSEIRVTQEFKNQAEIAWLYVPSQYRGSGYGRTLVEWTCSDADFGKIELVVDATPFVRYDLITGEEDPPAMNLLELRDWYRRFGFELDERDYTMVRVPR